LTSPGGFQLPLRTFSVAVTVAVTKVTQHLWAAQTSRRQAEPGSAKRDRG